MILFKARKLDSSFNQDETNGDLLSDELESFGYEITGNVYQRAGEEERQRFGYTDVVR